MEESTPLITFEGVDVMNGENTVLFGLNLVVNPGDFVYIVGKVGTGKTSIIRTVIAENDIEKGNATVCGYDIKTIRSKDIPYLRRKIGVVFQDFQLLMERSVHDNLAFVLEATGWKDKKEIEERIAEVLDSVGMTHKLHRMPAQLSGGEQQRIAIARALLNKPSLIVADEPTGNLDGETAEGIMGLLTQINAEGTAVVMVTHNRQICDRYPGKIYECKDESVRLISEPQE